MISRNTRSVEEEVKGTWHEQGFNEHMECTRAARVALSYLGLPYRMSEDTITDAIDCSTLVSQSLWMSTFQSCPLTAERLRTAANGKIVSEPDVLPGDVAIKYESLEHSPDSLHNHVAIVVGNDVSGRLILCEASEGRRVRLIHSEDFEPQGGYRRYCPSPTFIPVPSTLTNVESMARRVPKLGRQGVGQYHRFEEQRLPHQGVDIYVESGQIVEIEHMGELKVWKMPNDEGSGISLLEPDDSDMSRLVVTRVGHVEIIEENTSPDTDGRITRLKVVAPSEYSQIEYSQSFATCTHLHLEMSMIRGSCHSSEALSPLRELLFRHSPKIALAGEHSLP